MNIVCHSGGISTKLYLRYVDSSGMTNYMKINRSKKIKVFIY